VKSLPLFIMRPELRAELCATRKAMRGLRAAVHTALKPGGPEAPLPGMSNAQRILKLADTYAAHMGLRPSTVSSYAMNDGKRLDALRQPDAYMTDSRYARVVAWFDAHWPADLAWPADVPRPSKRRAA